MPLQNKRQLCEALRKQHGFDAISLMPTNLYGPGDNYHLTDSHVLPALIRRFYEAVDRGDSSVTCWGTGSPMREFLHVDDLGEASVFALEQWQPGSNELHFLNVGTGMDISIRDLADAVALATGFKGEIFWDESIRWYPQETARRKPHCSPRMRGFPLMRVYPARLPSSGSSGKYEFLLLKRPLFILLSQVIWLS